MNERISSRRDGHWLVFDKKRRVTGCYCGFEADVDADCGWGDSVVDHIYAAGRAVERKKVLAGVRCEDVVRRTNQRGALVTAVSLAGFLLARIAEDETEAQIASEIPWDWSGEGKGGAVAHFVTHMGPRRLKAESAAKRRIVERCGMVLDSWDHVHDGVPELAPFPDVNRRERSHAGAALRDLALPYADHPDYQQEWKP